MSALIAGPPRTSERHSGTLIVVLTNATTGLSERTKPRPGK